MPQFGPRKVPWQTFVSTSYPILAILYALDQKRIMLQTAVASRAWVTQVGANGRAARARNGTTREHRLNVKLFPANVVPKPKQPASHSDVSRHRLPLRAYSEHEPAAALPRRQTAVEALNRRAMRSNSVSLRTRHSVPSVKDLMHNVLHNQMGNKVMFDHVVSGVTNLTVSVLCDHCAQLECLFPAPLSPSPFRYRAPLPLCRSIRW